MTATGLLRNAPANAQIMRARSLTFVTYRQNVAFLVVGILLQVLMLQKVWGALYAEKQTVDGRPLQEMLVYLTLASLHTWVLQDTTASWYYYTRVRDGQIAFDLMRPIALVPQMLGQALAAALCMLALAVAVLVPVSLVGQLAWPSSPGAAALYVPSLVLGAAVGLLMTVLLGMAAFWTTEIAGVTMLYTVVGLFFSGALAPLSAFPGSLQVVARLLPFQATTYTPVQVYVGALHGRAAAEAMLVQLVWVGVLGAATSAAWLAARRRVIVQGG